ncbi:MAG: glycine cleavage system aminomethyltransferase GcvT [Verrucomicrobia bacterium]|nr:MAG: glycine cleavage system aminomethyltransferase GcvT [Verrucomicrobiota bacterium]
MSNTAGKKTPLYGEHVRLGARMVPFGGWLMPVQYSGIVDEHQAVRNAVGMFDISHMGQFIVSGTGARDWLDTMLTNNVAKLDVGQGQYTFLLNNNGGVIDDLIVYRTGDAEFLLVVNAAKVGEDFVWLEDHNVGQVSNLPSAKNRKLEACATLKNRSASFGGVAIQGPRVIDLFHELLGQDVELPARNCIRDFVIENMPVSVARTGYTGEDGVEVFFRANDAAKFWNLVLERGKKIGAKPCGLGARDTLRLEMCYPLNGSDLSAERNPIEAGLGFFVDLEKRAFTGRDKLLDTKTNGARERLVAFKMNEKGPPPRPHYALFSKGNRVGEITSGTLSPSLNIGIGMGYVSAASAKIGTPLEVEIRGQKFPATIEKKPLYKKQS